MFVSKRLNSIVDLIKYDTIADIACDHAFITILAYKNKGVTKSVASDLNEMPLNVCKENLKKYDIENASVRQGSGLQTIKKGEVETGIIAGLGGLLMHDMLIDDMSITKSFKQLILQPQSDWVVVRKFLSDNNIMFCEKYVVDNGKHYVIFDCDMTVSCSHTLTDDELEFGYNHIVDDEFMDFLDIKINENEAILQKVTGDKKTVIANRLHNYKKLKTKKN